MVFATFDIETSILFTKGCMYIISSEIRANIKKALLYSADLLAAITLFCNLFFTAIHYTDKWYMKNTKDVESQIMGLQIVGLLFYLPLSIIITYIVLNLLGKLHFGFKILFLLINAGIFLYVTNLVL